MSNYAFSAPVTVPLGVGLGGYRASRCAVAQASALEVNGIGFVDAASGLSTELISVDCLYAGDLARSNVASPMRIWAASHTHFAPMLDSTKPLLGAFSRASLNEFRDTVQTATRFDLPPLTRCTIYCTEVDIPIYRRFDYPASKTARWLSRHAGMFPNEALAIDRRLILFVFTSAAGPEFVIAYHACHPVSRHNRLEISSDFVGSLREAVRQRFGVRAVLFFQGCAGDVRPNIARKRFRWLPKSRVNWRFDWDVSLAQQAHIDDSYAAAAKAATELKSLNINSDAFVVRTRQLSLRDRNYISFPRLEIGELVFDFLPFEVSHLYHLETLAAPQHRFIVTCANHTLSYLPHPSQLSSGGYEVDESRHYTGSRRRVELLSSSW